MTIVVVCSVFDTAMQAFARPFFVPSTAMAVRSFGDEVKRRDADNPMQKHPEDFILYLLGTFDEERGSFTPPSHGSPEILVRAKDMVSEGS